MKHRATVGCEALDSAEVLDGIVRRSTSHIISTVRYKTITSDGRADWRCSSTKSKLRPNAAPDESNRDTTSMPSCWTGIKTTYINRRKDNKIPSTCNCHWHYVGSKIWEITMMKTNHFRTSLPIQGIFHARASQLMDPDGQVKKKRRGTCCGENVDDICMFQICDSEHTGSFVFVAEVVHDRFAT
jgi:hypothetical protein